MTFSWPEVADPKRVGSYPALAYAGGGYFWDEVLEYRVWCHSTDDDDFFYAFATYEEALAFSKSKPGREQPLALILQREFISEPRPGEYIHVRSERICEWPVELLRRHRRTAQSIPDFLVGTKKP